PFETDGHLTSHRGHSIHKRQDERCYVRKYLTNHWLDRSEPISDDIDSQQHRCDHRLGGRLQPVHDEPGHILTGSLEALRGGCSEHSSRYDRSNTSTGHQRTTEAAQEGTTERSTQGYESTQGPHTEGNVSHEELVEAPDEVAGSLCSSVPDEVVVDVDFGFDASEPLRHRRGSLHLPSECLIPGKLNRDVRLYPTGSSS